MAALAGRAADGDLRVQRQRCDRRAQRSPAARSPRAGGPLDRRLRRHVPGADRLTSPHHGASAARRARPPRREPADRDSSKVSGSTRFASSSRQRWSSVTRRGLLAALAPSRSPWSPPSSSSRGLGASSDRYVVTPLVSDGVPAPTDQLVNAWGLAASPTGPWWVANEARGASTIYSAPDASSR